ncbi:hypothetical protein [Mycobacterium sp. 1245805.9]|uniref:hypothetical protein n=1 Tax=Mycobacterium sp. 1245805.9 TaxID=1856862 RepID=UPI001E4A0AD9|nr:hypothetical protein [Mycobacterium sp. 1245805.9]
MVEPAAAACAARTAVPIPVKSCAAVANASGVAIRNDDMGAPIGLGAQRTE